MRGLQHALATLYSPPAAPFDMLAEREQLRVEDEARRARQGVLPLKPVQ